MQAAESSSARCVSCAAAQSFVNLISREEVPVEAVKKGFFELVVCLRDISSDVSCRGGAAPCSCGGSAPC